MELALFDNDSLTTLQLQANPRIHNGALHGLAGPLLDPAKPVGQWNTLTIRVEGRLLTATLNGRTIQDADLARLQIINSTHAGLKRTTGRIALQHWDKPRVEFRNIRIRELIAESPGGTAAAAVSIDPVVHTIESAPGPAGTPPLSDDDSPGLALAPFDVAAARRHQRAWAEYLGVPEEFTNSIGMRFRLIPPGEFVQGISDQQHEQLKQEAAALRLPPWYADSLATSTPQHRVRISRPYYMAVTEVTQEQFETVMGHNSSTFAANSSHEGKVRGIDTRGFPVDTVQWFAAVDFCSRLSEREQRESAHQGNSRVFTVAGYRLPTEVEWEFACRGGTETRWWWGNQLNRSARLEWFGHNSGGRPHVVGTGQPNPFGLYDMHGNCWEWCQDWSQPFSSRQWDEVTVDPVGPLTGQLRVTKGGAYLVPAEIGASFHRGTSFPNRKDGEMAFRVVLTVDIDNTSPGAPAGSSSSAPPTVSTAPVTPPEYATLLTGQWVDVLDDLARQAMKDPGKPAKATYENGVLDIDGVRRVPIHSASGRNMAIRARVTKLGRFDQGVLSHPGLVLRHSPSHDIAELAFYAVVLDGRNDLTLGLARKQSLEPLATAPPPPT